MQTILQCDWRSRFIFAVTVVALSISTLGDELPDNAAVDSYIAACESGNDVDKWREASKSLFANPDNEDRLMVLSRHPNHSLALRASWQQAANVLGFCHLVEDYREERRARLGRFLGRLEGRLRVEPPRMWEESLEKTYFFSAYHPMLPVDEPLPIVIWNTPPVDVAYLRKSHAGHPLSDTGYISSGLSGVLITGDEKLELSPIGMGRAKLTIPDRGLQIDIELYDYARMAAVVTDEQIFLVSYQDMGSCMVRMWRRKAENLSDPAVIVKRQLADTAMEMVVAYPTLQGDKLVVWIASDGGFSMDAYDASTMKLTAAFTTAF